MAFQAILRVKSTNGFRAVLVTLLNRFALNFLAKVLKISPKTLRRATGTGEGEAGGGGEKAPKQ